MNESITQPAIEVHLPPSQRTKWEREFQAFQRLVPELLKTLRGKYVAIHEEKVVESGNDPIALIKDVHARYGYVAIHVGHVTDEPEPIFRSGVIRDQRSWGGAR
jgi:hypothetical protein